MSLLRWRAALAGAALFVTLPIGCKRAAPPADENPPPAPVKYEPAKGGFIEEWIDLVGTTQPLPDKAARITAPVEGRVLTVLRGKDGRAVTEGQEVAAGTVIVQLDATIVRANRDRTEAQQKVLQQETTQAKLLVKLANIEVERLQELKESEAKRGGPTVGRVPLVSPIEIKKAGVALEDAQSKLQAAELKQKAGEQDLAALNEQLQLFTLTSPVKGTLGRILVVQGQTLAIGAAVTDVIDVSEQIDVLCFVPGLVARKLRLGQTAEVSGWEKGQSDEAPSAQGKVAFIAEQAEPDTGNFAVKIRFANAEAKLPVNTVLQVRVQRERKYCPTLPESALMEDSFPPRVVVVEDTGEKLKDDKGELVKDPQGEPVPIMKAYRLEAKIGLRDRKQGRVEILELEDPEKKNHFKVEDTLFVIEKGQGLQNDDKVRLEQDED
jgi:multidrug efflux pump subunit AcrA (membrane-fusion protein)